MTALRAQTRFVQPPGSDATAPAERRGLARDGVRLLVARPGGTTHHRFRDLPSLLQPGDLLVVNTSRTLPAAVVARRRDGRRVPVHVAGQLDDGAWVVEVRRPDRTGPDLGMRREDRLDLPGRVTLRLAAAYPHEGGETSRLWRAEAVPAVAVPAYLERHGSPIRYGHLSRPVPLADLQTVYAADGPAGSAEMASAGRPVTAELLVRLLTRGVTVAPVTLHAGVSSPEVHEPPAPERFAVPPDTARLVNSAVDAGRRVVAVGTTVVRALETAADGGRAVSPGQGWTSLVLGPDRPARVVTGLVSGLHAPEASHLLLLEAVAGPSLVTAAYAAAVRGGYLWHEFGDSTLFLP